VKAQLFPHGGKKGDIPVVAKVEFVLPDPYEALGACSDEHLTPEHFMYSGTKVTVVAPSRWCPQLRAQVWGAKGCPRCPKCGENCKVKLNGLPDQPRRVVGMHRDNLLWAETYCCQSCPGMPTHICPHTHTCTHTDTHTVVACPPCGML
jgi:hypothetical protein